MELRRSKEAVSFINNEALKVFPKDPQLYIGLAYAELDLGNLKVASKAAGYAHDLAPDDPEVAELLSILNRNHH